MKKLFGTKMTNSKKSSLFFVFFSMALIVFQLAAATIQPQQVRAATTAEMTATLAKYSVYAAVRSCILQLGIMKTNPDSKATGNDKYTLPYPTTFSDASFANSANTNWAGLGFVASGGQSNGRVTCSAVGKMASSTLAMTDDELMVAVGYEKVQGTGTASVWTYKNPANRQNTNNYINIANSFTAAVSAKGIVVDEPTYAYYFLAHAALLQGCGATKVANPTQTQATSGATGADGYWYIKEPNAAGTAMQEVLYQIAIAAQGNTVYAYPRPTEKDGEQSKTTCKEIIYALDSTAADRYTTSLATQNDATGLKAAAQVYAAGSGSQSGVCANADTRIDSGEYARCIDAVTACLQPTTVPIGLSSVTYTYRDMPVDIFTACFKAKAKNSFQIPDDASIKDAYTKLQTAAIAAADTAATGLIQPGSDTTSGADPCAGMTGAAMQWLACGIFTTIKSMVDGLSNIYTTLLHNDADTIFKQGGGVQGGFSFFRNLGLVLVIVAGLIMVIAQATGTDLVDAYTVKKTLPKLGVALVGIALAWPLLKFAVVLSNDLGAVAQSVFDGMIKSVSGVDTSSPTSPFNSFSSFFNYLFVAAGAIGGAVAAGGIVVGALGVWGTILLAVSLLITFLTGLIVLLIQQLLLLVLILTAPLAIAAYVLPGTEKLWKFWKSNFFKVIIMFFVIVMLSRVGDFLAALSFATGTDSGKLIGTLAKGATLILTFQAPKIASQVLGGIMGAASGMAYKMAGGLKAPIDKQRQQAGAVHREHTYGRRILSAQAEAQRRLKDAASGTNNRLASSLLRGAGRAVGGYNLEARMSQRQAAVAKEVNDQIATGADDEIRGLSVDKQEALRRAARGDNSLMRVDKDTKKRQFKSLGGLWVDEAAVDEGHRRWGNDRYAQQAALSYEMRKANSEEEVAGISSRYASLARNAWGMSDKEAGGAWIGAAFENQNQHIEFKKTDWDTGDVRYDALADEIYEKKGSYPLAQMHSRTIERLKQGYQNADDIISDTSSTQAQKDVALERKRKIEAITETFMSELGGGGGGGFQMDPATGQPVALNPPTGASQQQGPYRMANTAGAAHVAERVQELAVMTGAFVGAPSATYDQSQHHAADPITTRNDGTTINVGTNNQKQNRP